MSQDSIESKKLTLKITISRQIKFHQLHEIRYFWREPLDFIITKSKFP